jgi:oxygen-independent coproporphyrinogen-3 oxidase
VSGVAAASHLGARRFTRPRRLRDYLDWVAAGATVPPAEPDARDERLLDTLMLARAPLCRPACAAA